MSAQGGGKGVGGGMVSFVMATEARRGFSGYRVFSRESQKREGVRDWFRLFVIQFLSTDSIYMSGGCHMAPWRRTLVSRTRVRGLPLRYNTHGMQSPDGSRRAGLRRCGEIKPYYDTHISH